jgi:hypothetical protein
VNVFGANVYIAQTGEFAEVSEGSAVIAQKCEAYELVEGNLVLYTRGEGPALGYLDSMTLSDGIYTITVSDSDGDYSFEETELIGKADLCSPALGAIIRFSLTPLGIFFIAFLPCAALIIYDIIKAIAAKLPQPEVVPHVKNADDNAAHKESSSGISVKSDGNAAYSRNTASKSASDADSVLFNYGGRSSYTGKQRSSTPIISLTKPLSSNLPAGGSSAENKANSVKPADAQESAPAKEAAAVLKFADKPSAKTTDTVQTHIPASVAAKAYIDNTVNSSPRENEHTAEIPELPKKQKSDAFFAQSKSAAPQIGRQRSSKIVEQEDALAAVRSERSERKSAEYSGKRSSVILAGKSRSELMTDDDDDSMDKSRYEVDDILAGLEKRRNQ